MQQCRNCGVRRSPLDSIADTQYGKQPTSPLARVCTRAMIRTFQALRSIQPGFTYPEQVKLLRISIPEMQVKSAVCEIF